MDKITITIDENHLNQQNISPDEFKNAFEKNLKASGVKTDNLIISFSNEEMDSDILLTPENIVDNIFVTDKDKQNYDLAQLIIDIARKTAEELWTKLDKKNTK